MKKLAIIISVCFYVGLMPAPVAAQDEIALIMKSSGLVSVSYRGENNHALVSKGYLIMPEAVLQTGNNGFAVVKFIRSRSIVILRPRSEVILNASVESKIINESLEMRMGEVLLEIFKPHNHNFDLYSPAGIVSFGQAKSLVILSKEGDGTALYNVEGKARIADNNFSTWKDVNSASSAFATQYGFVQVSKLSQKALNRLEDIYKSTRLLEPGPPMVHNLIIKSSPNGVVEPSGRVVALSGVDVDIKAVPDQDYTFTGWQAVEGNARIMDISSPETKISVSSNALIKAQFEEIPSVLKIVKTENGITEPSGDIYVQKGAPVTIRIAPKQGYEFKGFKSGGKVKIEEIDPFESSVSLFEKKGMITPKFVKKSYALTIKKGGHGTVTPAGQLKVNHADSTGLSAIPDEGYQFIRWEVTSGYAEIANFSSPSTFIICDSIDASVQAHYSNNAVEVSILKHDLAQISPTGNFFVPRNATLNVTVLPQEGYSVSRWVVVRGKGQVLGLENAVVKCKTPFEIKPILSAKEYNLTLLSDGNGTVMPSGSQKAVHKKPFTIVAKPNAGKHFIRWKLSGGWAEIDDMQKDSTPVYLSKGDAVIQAEFAETICTLSIAATQGGYTEPVGKINNYEGGDIIIQAVPNPKAAFVGWEIMEGEDNIVFSDTLTFPELTVTNTKGNASLKAVFSTETVEMTVLTNGLGTTEPEGKFYAIKEKWNRIKATPNENQRFVQWTALSGDDVQFKDPLSAETEVFASSDDIVIKALFQASSMADSMEAVSGQGEYTVKIIYDQSKGSISTDETLTVRAGVPVVLTATPHKEYYFEQWRTNTGQVNFSNKYDASTTLVLSRGDAAITPVFLLKSIRTLEIRFKDYENKSRTITSKYR